MPAGSFNLTAATPFFEHHVQSLEARHLRDRHHEVGTGELHQPLDLAFIVALGRSPEPVPEQVVTDELSEGAGSLAFAVATDFSHRDFEVVIEDRQRHAVEEGKGRDMSVQECLRGLTRIGLIISHREQLTLELAILSEQKSVKIISLLEELRRDDPHFRNRHDVEAEALSTPADPNGVLEAIKNTQAATGNPELNVLVGNLPASGLRGSSTQL